MTTRIFDFAAGPYSSDELVVVRFGGAHGRLDKDMCSNTGPEEKGAAHYFKVHCGELRAVGLGPYADHDEYYSENSYREERGYSRREWY